MSSKESRSPWNRVKPDEPVWKRMRPTNWKLEHGHLANNRVDDANDATTDLRRGNLCRQLPRGARFRLRATSGNQRATAMGLYEAYRPDDWEASIFSDDRGHRRRQCFAAAR